MTRAAKIHRIQLDYGDGIGYVYPTNKKCIFFIHGLGGSNTERYWGRLIELMNYDDDLKPYDFYFWRYKSSHYGVLPFFFQWSRNERISTVPEVALALANALRRVIEDRQYNRISLIGHSLGGLIALLSCCDVLARDRTFPIAGVCLLATPLIDVWQATLGAWVFQDLNPHLSFLSDQDQIRDTLDSCIKPLRDAGHSVVYIHCIGDQLLSLYQDQQFSEFISMQGPHRVMWNIDGRQHHCYRTIASYIARYC